MKHYITTLILILIGGFCYGQVSNDFNPENPPEPSAQYTLTLQSFPESGGTVSGGGKYPTGTRVRVSASANTGFRFTGWTDEKGEVISSASYFYYTTGSQHTALTATFVYDPSNPEEPSQQKLKHVLTLVSEPVGAGTFNINSGEKHREGDVVYLYSYPATGFKFSCWKMGDEVLSTNRSYSHTMGTSDQEIKSMFYYDPSNPDEPGKPTEQLYSLITLTTQAPPKTRTVYPVYLLNQNIDITTVSFDIQFPESVLVDYTEATLVANRNNGHTMNINPIEGLQNAFHIKINGKAYLQGSEGVLVYIPVTIPESWANQESHSVVLSNAYIDGSLSLPTKNGAITSFIDDSKLNIYANFYTDAFMNRVQFKNLSSKEATNYLWEFGDSTKSTEKEPFHVFASSGDYAVKLIVSNEFAKDSIQLKVSIPSQDTWKWNGSVALNKESAGVKSFVDATELFTSMNMGTVTGDISVLVQGGQTFDVPLNDTTDAMFKTLMLRLKQSNSKVIFTSDKENVAPVINLAGSIMQYNAEYFKTIFALGQYLEFKNVDFKVYGSISLNLPKIYELQNQTVYSDDQTEIVNLKEISNELTYEWNLQKESEIVTGYISSGKEVIPSMTLINDSTIADTLTYQVAIKYSSFTFYTLEYKISVRPVLQGSFVEFIPKDGETVTSNSITCSWNALKNVVSYNLYFWKANEMEPDKPFASNIKGTRYSINSCKYGDRYQWKVEAVGEDGRTIQSGICWFSVRNLPDLHVNDLRCEATLYSGKSAQVSWDVRNNGKGATLPKTWKDRVWLVSDLKVANPFNNASYLLEVSNVQTLESGESYEQIGTVNIPERLKGDYYLVVTSGIYSIESIDFSKTDGIVPEPYTPDISGVPYFYLNAKSYNAELLEEGVDNYSTDNFFFRKVSLKLPNLSDLKVQELMAPTSVVEGHYITVKATITNQGDTVITNKKWSDYLYQSKNAVFDQKTATYVSSLNNERTVKIGEMYVDSFRVVAPVDSLANCYYFVKADANDNLFESEEDNNVLGSSSVLVTPYMMNVQEHALLKDLYESANGGGWYNQWKDMSSSRIKPDKWSGVSFGEDGHISAITMQYNNMKGRLPEGLFELSEVQSLNFSNNSLSGRLDSLFIGIVPSELLNSIVLTHNNYYGVIPASINNFIGLNSLILSGNHFDSVENVLSTHIKEIGLDSQTLDKSDSVQLDVKQFLDVPSICRYNHWTQSLDDNPNYSVSLDENTIVENLSAVDNGYQWSGRDWKYPSGQSFVLNQRGGLATGTTFKLRVYFKQGDTNIDHYVDVLDVTHSLNYIFGESPKPFNFKAADSYSDNTITVQDLVSTINLILDEISIDSGMLSRVRTNKMDLMTANCVYVENNKLVLEVDEPVSAMDISIKGMTAGQLRLLLNSANFQLVSRSIGDGIRFILFSPSGMTLPQGKNIIAELNHHEDAEIISADLSSPTAQRIPVKAAGTPTKLSNTFMENISVSTSDKGIYYSLPEGVEGVTASLFTVQGVMISHEIRLSLSKGKYYLASSTNTSPGIYLLQLSVKKQNQVMTGNYKLIISK